VHVGDKIIIIAYASMDLEEAKSFKPKVIIVNDENEIVEITDNLKAE